MEKFTDNLRRILKEKGISQKQLSKLANINLTTINSLLRRDTRSPDLETIREIAKALNVTESYLVFGTDIFNKDIFDNILRSKYIEFEELILETGCDPMYLINSKMPPLNQQDNIADYLKLERTEVFIPSYKTVDFFRAYEISKKSIKSKKTVSKEQFITMFDKLDDENRKIIYNLSCDLLNIQMNKRLKKYNK